MKVVVRMLGENMIAKNALRVTEFMVGNQRRQNRDKSRNGQRSKWRRNRMRTSP